MNIIQLDACAAEIRRLHDFFQAWFTGRMPQSMANFQQFAAAMHDDFFIISPDGQLTPLPPLLERLWGAYSRQPAIRIWTERHQLHFATDQIALCTYEEWQTVGDRTTARLSSVLFRRPAGNSSPLIWQHVHETWLAKQG